VLRLATLYAVMDESQTIEYEHLTAPLALWGSDGLTRTEIRDHFGRHKSAERINQALGELLRLGRVRKTSEQTGGRSTQRWFAK
jgi:hypothetical protein